MPYIRPSTYRGLALECRLSLLGYAAVIAGLALAVPLALPYLPFVLWFHCTTMLVFALPEHAGLHGGAQHEAGDEDDDLDGREPRKEPNAVAQLAMTRQFRSNFVYRYLAWNGNYHAAHHAYPSVPYYAISALSKALGPRIANQYGGYLGWYARADRTRVESEASAELA